MTAERALRRHECDDVFAALVPEGIVPTDGPIVAPLIQWLNQVARQWVENQYVPGQAPLRIEHGEADWLITNKVYEVDEFQPAHDCEECRSGNERAKAFLRENPGRYLAMANLKYTEVWDD